MGGTPEPRHGLASEVIAAALLLRAWDGCRSARLLRLIAGPGPSRAGRGQGAGHGCTGAEGLGEVLPPRRALGPVRDAARAQRAGGQGGAGTAGVHGVAAAGRRRGCLRGVTVCVRVPCPGGRAPHRAGCSRGPYGVHLSSAPALPAQAQGPRGDPVPAGVAIDCHGRRDSRHRPTARETAQPRNRAERCIDGLNRGAGESAYRHPYEKPAATHVAGLHIAGVFLRSARCPNGIT